MRLFCRLGLHRWDYCGHAYHHAPAPIRCERCGRRYGRNRKPGGDAS